jgi:hypothetical protein
MKFRKQFIPTILQMAGYKLQFDTFSQREIKVLKGKLPSLWTGKFQSNKCGSSSLSKGENYTLDSDS